MTRRFPFVLLLLMYVNITASATALLVTDKQFLTVLTTKHTTYISGFSDKHTGLVLDGFTCEI